MANSSTYLVRGIQRALTSVGPFDASGSVTPSEVAELRARLRRLRAMDDRFAGVRLSSYVTDAAVTVLPSRVRGACVATEV